MPSLLPPPPIIYLLLHTIIKYILSSSIIIISRLVASLKKQGSFFTPHNKSKRISCLHFGMPTVAYQRWLGSVVSSAEAYYKSSAMTNCSLFGHLWRRRRDAVSIVSHAVFDSFV